MIDKRINLIISARRSVAFNNMSPTDNNLLFEELNASGNRMPTPSNVLALLKAFNTPQQPFDIFVALVYNLFLEMGFVPAGADYEYLHHRTETTSTATATSPSAIVHYPTFWGYSYVSSIVSTFTSAPAILIEIQKRLLAEQQQQHTEEEATTSDKDCDIVSNPNHSPSNQTYKFMLKLLNFSEHTCLLLVRNIFNGDAGCVTFCRDGEGYTGRSVVIPIKQYIDIGPNVVDDDNDSRLPIDIDDIDELNDSTSVLKNCKELAQKMRSSIIIPIRNELMNEAGHPYGGLYGLPQEILWLLFERFDVQTLQNMSHVCMKMRIEIVDYIQTKGRRIVDKERRRVQIVRLPEGREPYQPFRLNYRRLYPRHRIYPDIL